MQEERLKDLLGGTIEDSDAKVHPFWKFRAPFSEKRSIPFRSREVMIFQQTIDFSSLGHRVMPSLPTGMMRVRMMWRIRSI